MKAFYRSLLALCFVVFWCVTSWAHPVETQSLAFGLFAIGGNSAQYTIVMSPAGVPTYHPKIFPFTDGQNAVFEFAGFPPDTELLISISDTMLDPAGLSGPAFDVVNFSFTPSPPVTDGSGALTLRVGATLRTSGSGVLYEDDSFTGTYDLNFGY